MKARRSLHNPLGYGLLFLPYVAAELIQNSALVSYAVAWLGSWLLLYLTLSGRVRRLPQDLPWHHQILRPFGLTQVIFVSFTCLTSIFYVMDVNGYYYLSYMGLSGGPSGQMDRVAAAQRYYVLGHAAVATGLLAIADYRRSGEWNLRISVPLPTFLLGITAAMTAIAPLVLLMGLLQISGRLQQIALVASVLALSQALPRRRLGSSILGVALFGFNLVSALLSGWKEEVIVVLILLCVFLYPHYRRAVIFLGPVAMALVLLALPTYNLAFRRASWVENRSAEESAALGLAEARSGPDQVMQNNWQFLAYRSSEIALFEVYLTHTPDDVPFYGTKLVEQSIEMLIPSAVWDDKPSVEWLVMQRVYDNRVADPGSSVSAKPQYLVDGYLSGGAFGVLLAGLVYGLLASMASRLSERWFGGYLLGSGLIYNSLFMIFWRGNCFEFFFNVVLWSFVIMTILFLGARTAGWLVRAQPQPTSVDSLAPARVNA